MSRFLFVVLPLDGHTNVQLALADALLRRGHQIAWCGPESYLRPLVGADAVVYPTGRRVYREQGERGMAALVSLWQAYLLPMAEFVLRAVDRAVVDFHPDVLVADQHALAGPLVAYRHGLPWVTTVSQAMELTRPYRDIPEIEALAESSLRRLWDLARLPRDPDVDLRFSPYLVIAFTTAALTGTAAVPDNCVLVGPAFGSRRTDPAFPWERLDPRRAHILITVGTLADTIARDFLHRMVQALTDLADRVQAVLVAPAGVVPHPPAHILTAARVPMAALLPRMDAVVCHAGMNTVCEALAHGVPLVVAPIRHDQPVVAQQVVDAGAGVRVPFFEADPAHLRAAVLEVLERPGYRDGARRVRDSFAAAGGAATAARHLERVAAAATPSAGPSADDD